MYFLWINEYCIQRKAYFQITHGILYDRVFCDGFSDCLWRDNFRYQLQQQKLSALLPECNIVKMASRI